MMSDAVNRTHAARLWSIGRDALNHRLKKFEWA
jgi:DNA-binding protein Fis